MNKKKIKLIIVLITIALVFYVKNKIDTRNEMQQEQLNSIDDGIDEPLSEE